MKLRERLYLLSIFRSPLDFVFVAYDPSSCVQMRSRISTDRLMHWMREEHGHLNDTNGSGAVVNLPSSDTVMYQCLLLDQDPQRYLVSWLIARIEVEPDDNGNLALALGYFSREKKDVLQQMGYRALAGYVAPAAGLG